MPNIWTHIIFGKQLLGRIGKEDLIHAKDQIRLFNLGCQGPDFLFYHHFLPWQKSKVMNELGSRMHREHCGPMLMEMLLQVSGKGKILISPEVIYVLGFLTHHVLDRNMHPYIFYKSGFEKWKHQRYEIILDTIMVQKFLGMETWNTAVWKQFDVGKGLPEEIVEVFEKIKRQFFADLSGSIKRSDWNKAYRDFVLAQKLFHDPIGVKQLLTLGKIEPFVYKKQNAPLDYLNEAEAEWNDPTSVEEKYTFSVWDLWEKALIDGELVLREAVKMFGSDTDDLAGKLGNLSYETGKPCESGLEIRFVDPII